MASNGKILQLLAPHMSKQFNDRIPEIEKANLNQVADTVTNYPTIANEFVEVLTNQVIDTMFKTRSIENPLSMFEKGSLSAFGKSLEMIYVDTIRGKDFTDRFGGSYEGEVLAPEKMKNVKVQYLTENSRLKYKTTISYDMLASAFRNENGLSSMLNQQVARLVDSYNQDKFLMTWKLIDTMNTTKVQAVKPIDKTTAKEFTRKVKEIVLNMGFPSTEFNTSNVTTVSKPDDLYIIMDTTTKALLDVELLAETFNMSKVEFESRIVVVPYFKDAKRIALIVDKDKIQIFNTKSASDTAKNGFGLFTNIVLHKWDMFGACDFANCVELRAEDMQSSTKGIIYSSEVEVQNNNVTNSTGATKPTNSGINRSMPYDSIVYDRTDADGTVIADLMETEIEVDGNGEIKSKKEKKVSKK